MQFFSNPLLIIFIFLCCFTSFISKTYSSNFESSKGKPIARDSMIPSIAGSVILKADSVKYDANQDLITATGNIHVFMDNYTLKADSLNYSIKKDILFAEGHVSIKDQEGKIILGERAILKDKFKQGIIDEFVLKLPDNSLVAASHAYRKSPTETSLYKTSFTPCIIKCNKEPIWQIKAQDTKIDYDKEKVVYKNAFFEVFGFPIVYLPYFSHPTPNASAKSGLLLPYVKNDNFVLPVYFRPKPNIDFTISPRFAKEYTIVEGEYRHLLKNGDYIINGSYGNPHLNKSEKISKNGRYHIFTKGSFKKEDINYGFDINRASDKAYLTNYFDIYDSFLESKVYANKVEHAEYLSVESYSFQGFRTQDLTKPPPLVFPRVQLQKLIGIDEDENFILKVKNDSLAYNEEYQRQIARNALELTLSTRTITPNGHLFNFAVSNRSDVYWVSTDNFVTNTPQENLWYRNIPELQTKWQYPLVRNFSDNLLVKIEPTIAAVIGKDYNPDFNKFALIDLAKYELSEYNLFKPNRFSGIDYHDYGKRISYGLNSSVLLDDYYLDAFLGQLLYHKNPIAKGNADYVGNASIDMTNHFKLYYRFRRSENFALIREEVGANTVFEKITTSLVFSKLNNVSKYYADDNLDFPLNKAKQISAGFGYQILPSLKLDTNMRIDLVGKIKLLQRSIKVTYVMDCVSISGQIYDDFTHDRSRGIKKRAGKTFAIGLKVLNM